ncbi:MAG: tellurite resistance/C4-dicarboxylate transporter family protein [Microthrixaceae bacterium]
MTVSTPDASAAGVGTRPADRLGRAVRGLFPGYFALVMATGIISVGAAQLDLKPVGVMFYVLAVVAYAVLVILNLARIVSSRSSIRDDLTSHVKGFAFLTVVAATNVLGSATGIVAGWWRAALVLWWVGLVVWVVLLYTTLISVVLRQQKPAFGKGINGTWFLLTVSTESIAVLGALLHLRYPGDLLAFTSLAAFLLGFVLYLIVMTMVFLRWTFETLEPTEADPPAWIAAGAVAITVLAGSNLLVASGGSQRLARLAPFVEGVVVTAWTAATFWFPVMIAIGVWRHLVRRLPLVYHPSYWALVFPLGMYSVATLRMVHAIDLDDLGWLPRVSLGVALVAWSATGFGLVQQGVRALRPDSGMPGPATP